MVAIATGNAWAIPLIDGASAAANGGDLGDVLKSVAVSYVAGEQLAQKLLNTPLHLLMSLLAKHLSAGVKELAVSAITQGTVAATQAIIVRGRPP